MLSEDRAAADAVPHVSAAWSGKGLTLLQRDQNEGMDFAAHNVTIELLRWAGLLGLLLVPGWRQWQQRLCATLESHLHAGTARALGAAAEGSGGLWSPGQTTAATGRRPNS